MEFKTKNYFKINLDNYRNIESSSVKLIGLTFDCCLTWSTHTYPMNTVFIDISDLFGKLGRVNSALRTLYPLLDLKSLFTAY